MNKKVLISLVIIIIVTLLGILLVKNEFVLVQEPKNIGEKGSEYIGEKKALEIASHVPILGKPNSASLVEFKGRQMYKVVWNDEVGNYAYVDAINGTLYDSSGQSHGFA
ncbi:hypothetical protein MBCUR_00760 [Methanobrevibacter curvatus]|uniref:PepSY domain-containing protein n=2 Tax=Methanobrevibacter curvatus TaxID=49547 RepID=A0A166E9A1_9EURY|nr:hypothetical protein MBCUR_00760 [Methanobrevibacter curvatus]